MSKQQELIRQIQGNLVKAENELRKASVFVNQAREELAKVCRKRPRPRSASSR